MLRTADAVYGELRELKKKVAALLRLIHMSYNSPI